jgi:hypothetical protein
VVEILRASSSEALSGLVKSVVTYGTAEAVP